MTLSILKLEQMIYSMGMIISKYYTINSICIYIEVFTVINGTTELLLVYIPSKYDFEVKNKPNIFEMDYYNSSDKNITYTETYAGEADKHSIQDAYNNIDISGVDSNLENKLNNTYKKQIVLKEVSDEDNKKILDINRQLERYSYCLTSDNYTICMLYKNYLCCLKRDGETIENYIVKTYSNDENIRFYVSVDLPFLIKDKNQNIHRHVSDLTKGFYRILDKYHMKNKNINNLQLLQPFSKKITKLYENSYNKKTKYDNTIQEYKHKINLLNENDSINKDKYINKLFDLKTKRDNLTISMDKLLFDNTIMIDRIIKNIRDFENFLKK